MFYVLAFVLIAYLAFWFPGACDRWRQLGREDRERERVRQMHDRMEAELMRDE